MKKLFLFFTVLTFGFTLTSCLDGGNSNYTTGAFAYITSDDVGTPYARPNVGKLMVSKEMGTTLYPGSYKGIFVSWDEDQGTKPLLIDGQSYTADNVILTGEMIDLTKRSVIPKGETEIAKDNFSAFECQYLDEYGTFFNDHWIVAYKYKIKKGQTAQVNFYYTSETTTESGNTVTTIDVELNVSGEQTEDTTVNETKYIALNMAQLRGSLDFTKDNTIYVKFRYYAENNSEPVVTQHLYPMRKAQSN